MSDMDTLLFLEQERANWRPFYQECLRWNKNRQQIQTAIINLPPQAQTLYTPLGWARSITRNVFQSIQLLGFRDPSSLDYDETVSKWAKDTNLVAVSNSVHMGVGIYGRNYLTINVRDGKPIWKSESPLALTPNIDPVTEEATDYLRVYGPDDNYATLYTSNEIQSYVRGAGINGWKLTGSVAHDAGKPPVLAFYNGSEPDITPMPEAATSWPVIVAATRSLLNAMVVSETMAAPMRVLAGISPEEIMAVNDGKMPGKWEMYNSAILAVEDASAKAMTLPAADLAQFDKIFGVYAKLISGLSGVPVYRLWSEVGGTPQSYDAASIMNETLVEIRRHKINLFKGSWNQLPELTASMLGQDPETVGSTEAVFAYPEMGTIGAIADATVKLMGAEVVSAEWGRERLGMSPAESALEEQRIKNSPGNQFNSMLQGVNLNDPNATPVQAGTGQAQQAAPGPNPAAANGKTG